MRPPAGSGGRDGWATVQNLVMPLQGWHGHRWETLGVLVGLGLVVAPLPVVHQAGEVVAVEPFGNEVRRVRLRVSQPSAPRGTSAAANRVWPVQPGGLDSRSPKSRYRRPIKTTRVVFPERFGGHPATLAQATELVPGLVRLG